MRNLKRVLVAPDDPAYLESQVQDADLVNFNGLNVRELREEFQRRQQNYFTTPFDVSGESLRLFSSSVSIWSGAPGAGKTTLLRHLACHLLAKNCGVFIASLEQDPTEVFFEHCCTAAGTWQPTEDQMAWFIDRYCDPGLFKVWSGTDFAEYAKLLAVIRVLAKQGVRHAIIDSLMCLDVSPRDLDQQQAFAKALRHTARLSGIHLHLVAHPRKPADSTQELDIWDVAGAKEVVAIADNVLFVARDKNETNLGTDATSPMKISIRKQRRWRGGQGSITGWFSRDFRQFTMDRFATKPQRYLPDAAFEVAA